MTVALEYQENCDVEVKGVHSEKYFRWSMRSPVNYFEPSELDYFCKHQKGGHCRFPQNLRSKSYQGKIYTITFQKSDHLIGIFVAGENGCNKTNPYYYIDHPYIQGYVPGCPNYSDKGNINYGAEILKCGVIRSTFKYTESNRNKAPLTLMYEWVS